MKNYVKRSGLTGKARKMIPVREFGERVECIADDNGQTVIVRRCRLYAESGAVINGNNASDTMPVSPALSAMLDRFLGVQ